MKHVIIPNPGKDNEFWPYERSVGLVVMDDGNYRAIESNIAVSIISESPWKCVIINRAQVSRNREFWNNLFSKPVFDLAELKVWWHVNVSPAQGIDSHLFRGDQLRSLWTYNQDGKLGPGASIQALNRVNPFAFSMSANSPKEWDYAVKKLSDVLRAKAQEKEKIISADARLDGAALLAQRHFYGEGGFLPVGLLIDSVFPVCLYLKSKPLDREGAVKFIGHDMKKLVTDEVQSWDQNTSWHELNLENPLRAGIFLFKRSITQLFVRDQENFQVGDLLSGFEALARLRMILERRAM